MTDDARLLDYLKRVTADLRRVRAELGDLRERDSEPIAIVGTGCRLPGGTDTPEALWELVDTAGEVIGGLPTDRGWDVDDMLGRPGMSQGGGFLRDAAGFDAEFFGISSREAEAMDPQQRLMLEVTWESLERAGIDPASLAESRTGVFTGVSMVDYANGVTSGTLPVPPEAEGYLMAGTASSVVSGRISYTLGLRGPALTVDTACSSSLVAIHLAVRSLRQRECSLALAGGATVLSGPSLFTESAKQGALSPDGRCKAFGAGADGTGFGEGAGAVVLERLSDAVRNGHRVLAVIRGGAVNQDGASNGLTAPNGPAQVRVVRDALADAGLTADDIDAVEAHGTGTRLGDPIEAEALLEAFGRGGSSHPLWLGSVKSNLGHTQAAAGVTSVIKMALALERERLPRTLHAEEPSPLVDWSAGRLRPLREPVEWPRGGRPRRAGVSSFGISGTNAHLVLEEAPRPTPSEAEHESPVPPLVRGGQVWTLSARSGRALSAQADRLHEHLRGPERPAAADVARTLATGRPHLPRRAAVVGSGGERLLERLRALADGHAPEGVVTGSAPQGDSGRRAVFVFPGHGGQWEGMAKDLIASSTVFAEAVGECERALAPYVDWSLGAVLRGDPEAPRIVGEGVRVEVLQPASWAVLVSLARLWRAAGVQPSAVVGHSQGEVAAACAAGILSLEDGARVVTCRSRVLRRLAGEGGAAVVSLGARRTAELLAPWGDRIGVAGANGPESTVVTGEGRAVAEFVEECGRRGEHARAFDVDYTSHCSLVDRVEDEMRAGLAGIRPRAGDVPFHSTVAPRPLLEPGDEPTGRPLEGTSLDGDYWYRNLRHGVLLEPVIRRLAQDTDVFVEVGPHPVLSVPVRQTLEAAGYPERPVVHTLRRGEDTSERFLTALAEAHCHGVGVDWDRVLGDSGRASLADRLPTYPFQRERYWLTAPAGATDPASLGLTSAGHPLLGARVPVAGTGQVLLTGSLDCDRTPWLAEHGLSGRVLLAGCATVEMLLHAGRLCDSPEITDLTLHTPLELTPGGDGTAVQVVVDGPDVRGRREVRMLSASADGRSWTVHAEGRLAPAAAAGPAAPVPPGPEAVPLPAADAYTLFAAQRIDYGRAFRGLRAAWADESRIWADVALDPAPPDAHAMAGPHPALVDAGLQTVFLRRLAEGTGARPLMPFGWSGVRLHATGTPSKVRVQLTETGPDTYQVLVTDGETPLLSVDSLVVREAPADWGTEDSALFHQAWEEVDRTRGGDAAPDRRSWALVGASDLDGIDRHADAAALTAALDRGAPAPELVLLDTDGRGGAEPADALAELHRVLGALQGWLDDERLTATRFLILTRGAARLPDDDAGPLPANLPGASVWGLVASAESEHPGRFLLLDADRVTAPVVARAVGSGEPRLAARDGRLFAPRLTETGPPGEGLALPVRDPSWRLDTKGQGVVDGIDAVPDPDQRRPLGPGEVRVAVRAAGLNFRDVLMSVNMYPDPGNIGNEGSGVVLEAGPDSGGLAPGDRVMGLFPGAFGPVAVADHRYLARVPDGWDHADAAAVPVVYLTAYLALVEEAGIRAGETLLIHSAAGGVGLAALGIARHLGVRVLATASPEKWDVLRAAGVAEEDIAHSRRLDFEDRFRASVGTVDVVLNSLTGEAIDASLRLLAPGGRFSELGRNELRDPERIAAEYEGARYRAFNVLELGPERIQRAFAALLPLLESGAMPSVPVTRYPIENIVEAFQVMQQGRNVGKIVLDLSTRFRPGGTVLITGGTGRLGALFARHLVVRHGVRELVLLGRRGPDTPGADELVAELGGLGARVRFESCDVADADQLGAVLDRIPREHPLTAVVHAAAEIDDATVTGLTGRTMDRVLRPKVQGAWNLHRLTADLDLDAFVLFSAAAGVLGNAGQSAYAAANFYLDALAHHRREQGLAAHSLAWGRWGDGSQVWEELDEVTTARMSRIWGMEAIEEREGCALLDAALATEHAHVVPAPLDLAGLRARAAAGAPVPAILRGLVAVPEDVGTATAEEAGAELVRRAAAGAQRTELLARLIAERAAVILGHRSDEGFDPGQDFLESGFDSLTAVELRNHLQTLSGLHLRSTLVFQYRTPQTLAAHVDEEMSADTVPDQPASGGPGGSDSLVGLFLEACGAGRHQDAVNLAVTASRARAVHTGQDAPRPRTTALASGEREPVLICHPSLVMTSGPQEFSRFATTWHGRRDLRVLTAPGYLPDESLPADLDTFVREQTDAALEAAGGRPFVLLGRSSGGWAAHAVAEELVDRGTPAVGLVLLDTAYPGDAELLPLVTEFVTERATEFELMDTARLTAMGAYLDLFADWRPGRPVPGTVQIRPTSPVVTSSGAKLGMDWTWPAEHIRVDVPGDHFTMLEEHAEASAAAVEEVIAGRL
ncbi:phenolphthiocerol synthesis polyketide synthase type I Pks15/1 [Nocardiopsis terrae]|uniref:Acyl transferase domain-containing protein/D-arabinose 1-dehydrogenase-like Zn-dependent alcohol dehydrogenase/thioesterase domain-containing protein n=1 Tax=Nocardiopsis terrae TaxID=372655 RepID=A0ABR9HKS5_9ACTN|nr:type I polyketide synthase [Nocardiopsis terrae]MBE1459593.1 acyl transferase domain-containing protein/D-arabinose 1-dehydrogenase-like Zn-dependent alcohol dehydrogenase/thioesterase domain-containing protein [Nocardiopsis terrae]GHC94955.1 phenolphthiocerol synthesis polyketide synthase type I Pks15/1 [Nocardiopsis terrae]